MSVRFLATGGVGFAACVALARAVDEQQQVDAYALGLATLFLVAFLGALRATLRAAEGESGPWSAVATIGGSAVVPLYGVLAMLHLTVPSDERDIVPWMFAASFPQAATAGAVGAAVLTSRALPRSLGVASLAVAATQLLAAALILSERTDAYGSSLSAATFALWAAGVGVGCARARHPR